MVQSRRRQCLCGATYLGHATCTRYQHCPGTQCGTGSWHLALPMLRAMAPHVCAQRYPGLSMQALGDRVGRTANRLEREQCLRHHNEVVANSPLMPDHTVEVASPVPERHPPVQSPRSQSAQERHPLAPARDPREARPAVFTAGYCRLTCFENVLSPVGVLPPGKWCPYLS